MNQQAIIFCTNGIFPDTAGGIQRHSRLLIEEIARSYPLQIYVLQPHGKKVFDDTFKNITEIYIEPTDNRKIYLLEIYRYSKRMFQAIKKLPAGIPIYCQGFCLFYGLSIIGKRVVYNPHGLEAFQAVPRKEYLKLTPFRFYTDCIMWRSKKVISLGGRLTKIIKGRFIRASKIAIIPNAVLLPPKNISSAKFQNKKINFLFVSRFASNKGINILMETIKQLNHEGYSDKFQFNLAGKGPLFEYYSTAYPVENVIFLGFVPDAELFKLYHDNDVFVLPTLFEGMPTVVLEAMSYSMPVIVTDVGATAELVDKKNGYLIQKNSVSSLKKAILELYNLPMSQKKMMANNSYAKVGLRYTWDKVAKETVELLSEMGNND